MLDQFSTAERVLQQYENLAIYNRLSGCTPLLSTKFPYLALFLVQKTSLSHPEVKTRFDKVVISSSDKVHTVVKFRLILIKVLQTRTKEYKTIVFIHNCIHTQNTYTRTRFDIFIIKMVFISKGNVKGSERQCYVYTFLIQLMKVRLEVLQKLAYAWSSKQIIIFRVFRYQSS